MFERLSSELLEKQFGPTAVEILHQDDATRIIATRTLHDDKILEISRVVMAENGALLYPDVYQAMRNGESMGKAFTAAGIAFMRKERLHFRKSLSAPFNILFNGDAADDRPCTIIPVSIVVGQDKTPFAEILETYSPDVFWRAYGPGLSPAELESLEALESFLSDRTGMADGADNR